MDNGRLAGDSSRGGRGERKTLGGKQKLVQFMRDPECDGNVPPSIGVQSNLRFDWGLGKNSSSSTKPQSHKAPLRSLKDSAPRRPTLTVSPECAEIRRRSLPAYRFFTVSEPLRAS